MLLLDDVHHFDTASWRLLAAVAGSAASTLLVAAAMRPRQAGAIPVTAGAESVAACVQQCKQVETMP